MEVLFFPSASTERDILARLGRQVKDAQRAIFVLHLKSNKMNYWGEMFGVQLMDFRNKEWSARAFLKPAH